MPVKLGELLVKENMVTPQQLQEALNHQKAHGGKLGKAFVSLGYVRDEEITSLLSRQYGVPSINLDHFEVDPAIIKVIPAETARKYQILPLSRSGATLTIAMADPTNVFAMDDIKFMTGYNVEPVVASEAGILEAIETHYGASAEIERKSEMDEVVSQALQGADADLEMVEEEAEQSEEALAAASEDAPVVKLVNLVLTDAMKRGASDIHMEP
jgi:type IV pilus assembly protein PilB